MTTGSSASAAAAAIDRIASARERVGLGLLSGTSADGVDAAIARFADGAPPRLVLYRCTPLPDDVRRGVLDAERLDTGALALLDARLGALFGDAAAALAAEAPAGVKPSFVGSHGQTVFHRSRSKGAPAVTLQIGEPAEIARRTGLVTVADFRPSDVAEGGEGAPLVPLLDRALFPPDGVARLVVNLGGIANLTALDGKRNGAILAFDSGPANMPIDLAVRRLTRGAEAFDCDGRLAASGRVDGALLSRLLEHPFLAREAPKSTGAQEFGPRFVEGILAAHEDLGPASIVATLTAFSAEALALAYRRWVEPRFRVAEVVLSGGGARNLALVARIRGAFTPVTVVGLAERGLDPDAKEAVLFALLAHETLFGRPGNVPAATGAAREAVLGKIVLP